MRLRLDKSTDTLSFRLDERQVIASSEEVRPGVILEFDAAGRVVGVELREVSTRVPVDRLNTLRFTSGNQQGVISFAESR